jgi:hypothetical protein
MSQGRRTEGPETRSPALQARDILNVGISNFPCAIDAGMVILCGPMAAASAPPRSLAISTD